MEMKIILGCSNSKYFSDENYKTVINVLEVEKLIYVYNIS